MSQRTGQNRVSSKELAELIEVVLESPDYNYLQKRLADFSKETVAFLLTHAQIERAAVLYLPLLIASTPLEVYAKNLASLEAEPKTYKVAAVSLFLEKENIRKLKGKEKNAIRDFVSAQEKHSSILKEVSAVLKRFLKK